MKEDIKAELDILFKKKNKITQERRRDPRTTEFESHLIFLEEFVSVQDQIIRPMMVNFGRYLETIGHRYFISSALELIEGHLYPISKITLNVLLNTNIDTQHGVSPSFTYRIDDTKCICVHKKIGSPTATCSAVGRYSLQAITNDLVESHIKEFIIETVSL